jgi:putative membrane protein
VFVLVLAAVAAACVEVITMMDMMDGSGSGGWIGSALLMLIFWGGLGALIVFLLRAFRTRPSDGGGEPGRHDARMVLEERFARGEISEDEFEQRTRVLSRRDAAGLSRRR